MPQPWSSIHGGVMFAPSASRAGLVMRPKMTMFVAAPSAGKSYLKR